MPATAMILAAGRGERLRPHTDHTPKPLLPVRGKRLIEWQLEALARSGVQELVINTAWLEAQFPATLGDGSRWGLRIRYSMEQREHGGALETAGGIAKALPWLDPVFWVLLGRCLCVPGFDFSAHAAGRLPGPDVDGAQPGAPCRWRLRHRRRRPAVPDDTGPRLTWASVGPSSGAQMFEGIAAGTRLPLRPLMQREIAAGRLRGRLWQGEWTDVGTPQRWQALQV